MAESREDLANSLRCAREEVRRLEQRLAVAEEFRRELLAACEAAMAYLRIVGYSPELGDQLSNAIARAKGWI